MSATTSDTTPRGFRYIESIYYQDGATVTAILVSLLYLVLAVSLDAAGYVDNLSILFPVALGAFAVGFLMSISRYDGFFALTSSMFIGLAWILFLMSRNVSRLEIAPILSNGIPMPQAQAYYVLLQWLNWGHAAWTKFAADYSVVVNDNNYVFILEMCFLVWWLTYLGVWSIFRYGYTWRAVIPAGIVLLINAFYAPDSILVFLVIFFLIGLLLLVRTNLSEHQLHWRQRHVHYNQDIALDFLRNGLLYSITVLALAIAIPGLGRNSQVRAAMAPINQQWEETQERVNELYTGLNRRPGVASASFGNRLTLGGERNVTDDVVFRVDSPDGRYWRAVVYDTFTGQSWLSTASGSLRYEPEDTVPVAAWRMRQPITQTVTLEAPTGYVLFSAPDILNVDVPIEATVRPLSDSDDSTDEAVSLDESATVEITYALSRRTIDEGDSYTVVSWNTTATVNALRSANVDYPQVIVDPYLQLPETFSQRIAQDAVDITAQADTVYDKARAIEVYLRGYTYNDAIQPPPQGVDPIEYFLYDIREGYCDYYATAMTLMLRSLGIPARAVSGYAEGSYDEEEFKYVVTQRDAHTWVEVFFPEYGWIEFEPTAGESQLNRPSGLEQESSLPSDSSSPSTTGVDQENLGGENLDEPFSDPGAFGEDFDLGGQSASSRNRLWWISGVILPILLAGGLVYLWRTRFSSPTVFDPNLASILYNRLLNWSSRLGLNPSPAQTPYENARQFSRAVPEGQSSIVAITNTYVEYSYSGKHIPHDAEEARSAWATLQPVLWRAWFKKLTRRKSPRNGDHYSLLDEKQPPRIP